MRLRGLDLTIIIVYLGGITLLGVMLRRANAAGALAGMLTGLAAMLVIQKEKLLVWTWYVLAGALITFAAGVLVSLVVPRRDSGT